MGDEKMLPPMIIFKGKTDRTISDLNIPAEVIMKLQEKAWMDDHLMKVRVEDIWIKHIWPECQKLGFENALLTFDAFATHLTDNVASQLLEAKTDTLAIPAGCTSKCQPMDVCLHKPFKAILQKCWVDYILSVVETFPDASQDPQFHNSNTNTAANGRLDERVLRLSNTKLGDGQALIWGLWDYSIRYQKGSKYWLLQTVYERCARKFGKWNRRRRRQPFHFVDRKKISRLTESNDALLFSIFPRSSILN